MARVSETKFTAADLPFLVKVCGITKEEDLEVSLRAGAHAVGFNFYPKSPRFLTPARARQIGESVPGPYIKVGVFVNPSPDELRVTASLAGLDVLQLHGNRLPENLAGSFHIWRAGHAGMSRVGLDPNVEAWLLDTPSPQHGGTGTTFDWSLAADFPGRVVVAGGLDASNVATAIEAAQPWGVDACSLLEASPGQKDPLRIRLFVEAALTAFEAQRHLQPLETHS
jgi:phosphoribosylanthranilate isomerase